jgi:hypothetical protein
MSAPWAAAIAAIVAGTPRLPRALCQGEWDIFDGDTDETARQAAELCQHCPELGPCREWSSRLAHNEANGILAGRHRIWVSHPSLARKADR